MRVHFPSKEIEDIILTGWDEVDVFGRMRVTAEQIKMSNLSALITKGDVMVVVKK